MSSSSPRVAVVGSGYWGKNLVRNYASLGALGVICDKDEAVLAGFRSSYPDVQTCLAVSDVLGNVSIQGVVIATPAETHYNLVRESLLAGKHVYVEKPLVLDENQGREVIDLAEARGLTLMVGHLLQYHPVFIRLRDLAASGELGRINYMYSNRLNLGKIRREENSLWSFAPHDISMILSLAGEKPERITATGGNYLHRKIADVTMTNLDFPSGLKAHIFVSWLHPFKEQKLVVVGEKKMAVFDDTLPWADKLLLYPHQIRWEQGMPVPTKAEPERLDIPQAEPLRAECIQFLDCMTKGCAPRTDGREGLAVLEVLNAAQRQLDGVTVGQSDRRTDERWDNETVSPTHRFTDSPAHRHFIHPTAVVDGGARIGAGTKVWHFSHVLPGSEIGGDCNIGQNVVVGPRAVVGRGCKIQNNVSVYEGVTLQEFVFCGPSMVFTNIFNPRAAIRKMDQVRPTLVKRHATLGANCTIVCGVTVGAYAFVGAGAVIIRDVPDHALMVGNPARQVGWACRCGESLDEGLGCAVCGWVMEKVEEVE